MDLKKKKIGIISLFILGELLTFGFIVMLQYVSVHDNLLGFIMTLLAMHVGIVSFILSKKFFKLNINLKKHYLIEYLMLACYLPFLGLAIFKVNINKDLKLHLVLGLTIIVFIISVINDYYFIKHIKGVKN